MRHPHPTTYNVLWAARNGAVGGAILGIPFAIISALLDLLMEPSSSGISSLASIIGTCISAGASAGSAALGARVLISSLGAERVKQGVKESAIAGAVGSALILGACLALSLIAMAVTLESRGSRIVLFKFKAMLPRRRRTVEVVEMQRVEIEAAGPLVEANPVPRV
jgi:hypothetical protein